MYNCVLLGAGAIGVLPAVKLLDNKNVSLQVAASGERLARYRKEGIFFNDRRIDFNYAAPDELRPADLVIVATKTTSMPDALFLLHRAISPGTVILPLLNGIESKEIIEKIYPQAKVLYGLFMGHASSHSGNRITHDGVGTLCFGYAANTPPAPEVKFAAELLRDSGVDCQIPADMLHTLWQKFVINIGINQTQARFMADYGTVQQNPELLSYAENLMLEAVNVARALGIAGCDSMIDGAMKLILSIPPDAKTSMLQDILAGRKTEVDSFAGSLCRLARKLNIPTPKNQEVLEYIRQQH